MAPVLRRELPRAVRTSPSQLTRGSRPGQAHRGPRLEHVTGVAALRTRDPFSPSGRPRTALPPVPSRLGAGELGPKSVTRSGGYRGNPQRSWQRHWQVHRPLSAFRNIESRHKDSCSQAARLQEGPIPWAGSAGGAGPGHCGAERPASPAVLSGSAVPWPWRAPVTHSTRALVSSAQERLLPSLSAGR